MHRSGFVLSLVVEKITLEIRPEGVCYLVLYGSWCGCRANNAHVQEMQSVRVTVVQLIRDDGRCPVLLFIVATAVFVELTFSCRGLQYS